MADRASPQLPQQLLSESQSTTRSAISDLGTQIDPPYLEFLYNDVRAT